MCLFDMTEDRSENLLALCPPQRALKWCMLILLCVNYLFNLNLLYPGRPWSRPLWILIEARSIPTELVSFLLRNNLPMRLVDKALRGGGQALLERAEMHSVRCLGVWSRRGLKKSWWSGWVLNSCLGHVELARLRKSRDTKDSFKFPYLKEFGTIVWPNLRAAVANAFDTAALSALL